MQFASYYQIYRNIQHLAAHAELSKKFYRNKSEPIGKFFYGNMCQAVLFFNKASESPGQSMLLHVYNTQVKTLKKIGIIVPLDDLITCIINNFMEKYLQIADLDVYCDQETRTPGILMKMTDMNDFQCDDPDAPEPSVGCFSCC